ncbi:MAG: TIR domain-containing protein [Gammaproteobacteria bacterium]|nr:TIR domain-containing protein [Gammaproteobacteria bacterium]
MNAPEYQVALSFAGEQRDYVEEVARHLQSRAISVFYDGFEAVRLWGQSGVEAFHEAFAQQSAYVVMFISNAYVSKAWPRHERRSAFSHMIEEQREYVLPVRFDDTPVPGLPADIIYRNACEFTPAQLAAAIAKKLGIQPFAGKASGVPPPRMTSPTGEVVFDYSSYNGRYAIGSGVLEFESKWTKASDTSIHVYNDPPSINGIALASGCDSISQVKNASSLDYSSRTRTSSLGQIVVLRNTEGFYAAVHVLGIKDDSRHDDRDELRFRYAIQSDGSDDFTEFVDVRPT